MASDPAPAPEPALSPFGVRNVPVREKPALVRAVFDRVAARYDVMNDLMSGGVHRLWKDAAAARLNPQPGEVIIDCAGGTGDMARRLGRMAGAAQRRRGGPDPHVVVVDYNAAMVDAGRRKGQDAGVTWAVGDAQALPLADASADAMIISFGLRNVADVGAALAEARRVLAPGGRWLCLEFSTPTTAVLRAAYDAYSFHIIPRIGQTVAGDREAYQYLVESIRRFPSQPVLAQMMRDAGFARVSFTNFSGGVAALHQGWAV
ncbi:MAG TPA: class I SAM-dependent methyltransferase [Caulobacteraceae bacterium]|jgi:demethylmenaquinone methyltransferase/2-methoxy-6-polyprenyl-1,4-benzoquinol methylase|nr:class I SAM-dependent methyltransferase [Caulobacteraceae bacterium]